MQKIAQENMKDSKKSSEQSKPRKIVEKDFYHLYHSRNPNDVNYVTQEEYKLILTTFFDNLIDHLIVTGDTYKTPSRMGEFFIIKFPAQKTALNYKAWKEGKFQLHTNGHTFGYCVGLRWERLPNKFKNRMVYKFTAVRKVKRRISKQNQINNYTHKYRNR